MTGSSLAFLILAHTDAALLRRLLAALPAGSHKIVHIDAKSGQLGDFVDAAANTYVLDERVPVYWAGFSAVEATLAMLRHGLDRTDAERFVLLSGQSYPLAGNDAIIDFFATRRDDEFIKYFDMSKADRHFISKLETHFFSEEFFAKSLRIQQGSALRLFSRGSTRLAKPFRRRWKARLNGVTPAYGSQWWALTRDCARHVVKAAETQRELGFFRQSFAPDEMYFHTIVANSPFHARAGGFQPFQGRGNWRLNDLHHLNAHGSLRKIYALEDWDEIAPSKALFLRKLSSGASDALIEKIESDLRC